MPCQKRMDPRLLALMTVLLVMPWTPVHASEGSDEKEALADQIIGGEERRSGRPWDPAAKASLSQALQARSLADLEAAAAGERPLGKLMNAAANATLCATYNNTGLSFPVKCTARCCRIPGR